MFYSIMRRSKDQEVTSLPGGHVGRKIWPEEDSEEMVAGVEGAGIQGIGWTFKKDQKLLPGLYIQRGEKETGKT